MATIITDLTKKALLVKDAKTNLPIDLPLEIIGSIMEPVDNLRTWINNLIRTGGVVEQSGHNVKYYAFPKQTDANRKLEITYDDATGKINGGMFGAADANDEVGGIRSTYGVKIVSDILTFKPALFLKHRFSIQDEKQQGLENLVAMKLRDWTKEIEEKGLMDLKKALVAAIGTTGKWATDAGYVAPTTGDGVRILPKDYTIDAAGGIAALNDIIAKLEYRDKIGLKDGVESTYPFARGQNSSSSCKILIYSNLNKAIIKAVEESKNGWVAQVGVNPQLGIVNSISYEGKTVQVQVVSDMPSKASKVFNWLIIEVGQYGAMALPNRWTAESIVRPSYESMELTFKELEAIGLEQDLKFLQPELMFASFGA